MDIVVFVATGVLSLDLLLDHIWYYIPHKDLFLVLDAIRYFAQ